MNVKTTLVLVVLLVIVGAYVFFIGRGATPTYEIEEAERSASQERGEPLLEDLTMDAVTRLAIRRGDEAATFEKVGGTWMQIEPARFPADGVKLDALVRAATELRYVDRVKAGASGQPTRAELSLEPPRATVTITAGDTEHTVALGRKSTGGRGYVALGEGGDIYVVNDAMQTQVFTPDPLANWRRKALQAATANELDEVVVATADDRISATKRDGRWYLGEGTGERASEEAIADLSRNVGSLVARDFVSDAADSLAAYGLEQPRLTITLRQPPAGEDEQAITSTLRLGGPADLKEESFYATWTKGPVEGEGTPPSTVVFTLPKSGVDRLATEAEALRDKRLAAVRNAADVTSVKLARVEGGTVQLQREGGAWRFGDPNPGFALDAAAANDLVDTILTAEAERFEPAPTDGEPVATVTLRVAGRDQPEVLRLYPASGEDAAAQWLSVREGERIAYAVPRERLRKVFEPAVALREKSVLTASPDALTGLTLEQPGGPTLAFTRAEGKWSLQDAEAFEAADLERLVDELTRLRAESWVTDGRTPGDAPVVATLQLADGTRVLRVDPDTRVGTVADIDTPFVVPGHVVDLLTREYRDRTALPWTLDEIASVTLTRGDESLTIRKGDDGQYVVEGTDEPADQAQAAAVFDTLAGLRVKRWLDTPRRDRSAIGMIGIDVAPAQGEPRKLTVYTTDDAGTLGEGDVARWFVLEDTDVAKIVAPIAPEEADKARTGGQDVVK